MDEQSTRKTIRQKREDERRSNFHVVLPRSFAFLKKLISVFSKIQFLSGGDALYDANIHRIG